MTATGGGKYGCAGQHMQPGPDIVVWMVPDAAADFDSHRARPLGEPHGSGVM